MASYPDDVRYTDKHQWVRTREKIVTLGITQFAADRLGAIGFVELPYAGERYSAGAAIGRLSGESAAAAIAVPFDVRVISVNAALADTPGLINSDAYDAGWILRLEPRDPADLEQLMDAERYEASLAE